MLIPHTLTVLMTNTCTARCAHCCMNSSPERKGSLNAATVIKAINDLHNRSPLSMIVFAGGEPTLEKRALDASLRHCVTLGIPTRLVTNASWARTSAAAQRTLARLRRAGLNELNISADDYHLPFIPFTNVINAWRAAREMDFQAIVIANSYGPGSRITPEFIRAQLGEDVPLRFDEDGNDRTCFDDTSDATYLSISNAKVQRLERAEVELTEQAFGLLSDDASLDTPCPHAVQSAALSPRGHLLSCCGFELDGNEVLDFGDVRLQSANNLVDKANDDMIVGAIAYFGPMFLKRFVKVVAPEVVFPERYGSVCEVCRSVVKNPEAVKALRDNFRRLGPMVLQRRMQVNNSGTQTA